MKKYYNQGDESEDRKIKVQLPRPDTSQVMNRKRIAHKPNITHPTRVNT